MKVESVPDDIVPNCTSLFDASSAASCVAAAISDESKSIPQLSSAAGSKGNSVCEPCDTGKEVSNDGSSLSSHEPTLPAAASAGVNVHSDETKIISPLGSAAGKNGKDEPCKKGDEVEGGASTSSNSNPVPAATASVATKSIPPLGSLGCDGERESEGSYPAPSTSPGSSPGNKAKSLFDSSSSSGFTFGLSSSSCSRNRRSNEFSSGFTFGSSTSHKDLFFSSNSTGSTSAAEKATTIPALVPPPDAARATNVQLVSSSKTSDIDRATEQTTKSTHKLRGVRSMNGKKTVARFDFSSPSKTTESATATPASSPSSTVTKTTTAQAKSTSRISSTNHTTELEQLRKEHAKELAQQKTDLNEKHIKELSQLQENHARQLEQQKLRLKEDHMRELNRQRVLWARARSYDRKAQRSQREAFSAEEAVRYATTFHDEHAKQLKEIMNKHTMELEHEKSIVKEQGQRHIDEMKRVIKYYTTMIEVACENPNDIDIVHIKIAIHEIKKYTGQAPGLSAVPEPMAGTQISELMQKVNDLQRTLTSLNLTH